MDAIELDPNGYRGTYKLVGGRPSLDLVNTISWPDTEREHDWLDSSDNVRRWLRAVDLAPPPGKSLDLQAVHAIRAMLAAVLKPLAHGHHPPRSALETLGEAANRATLGRRIDPSSLQWRWALPADARDALGPVLLDAADLVTAASHERLRYCPACDWLFEDRTRNGQRRWCDMADCGSRDKARRYYHRSKD